MMLFPQWYLIQTTLYHSINNWMLDQIDPMNLWHQSYRPRTIQRDQ